MNATWRVESTGGLTLIRCEPLRAVPGIAHAFSTRRAHGRPDFDLGGPEACGEEFLARRRELFLAAGLGGADPATVRQVHGAHVVRTWETTGPIDADGMVWWARGRGGGPVPSVRSADCLPLLLADRSGRACAAAHAGWRGTAAGIAGRVVRKIASLGIAPGDLVAALGPAIDVCCYEVGPEVVEAVSAAAAGQDAVASGRAGRYRLDLFSANRRQLVRAGMRPDAIHEARMCTACRADLFFSHRREGAAAGRMMACVGPVLDGPSAVSQ